MTTTERPPLPLSGLRILDLSHFLAGPYATMILADLGADVVKVEPPTGDPVRTLEPADVDGQSSFFFSVNRNKRSVTIDLKSPEGRGLFLSLVDEADVVCHNFRPGVLEALGLGYEDLVARKSSIVLCSIYGVDNEGPYAELPIVDTVLQAMSGVMDLTGEEDGPPARVGYQIGDTAGGLWAAIAILAGVYGQRSDGVGRHVEISLLDAQLSLLVWQAQDYLTHNIVYKRMGTRHALFPPSQSMLCADGRYVWASPSAIPAWWRGYCAAIGRPELATDERFAELPERQKNRDVLEKIVADAFLTRPSDYWVAKFRECGVPVALVHSVGEAFEVPTVKRRNMVVEVELSDGATTRMVGNPIKTGSTEVFRAARHLGADNDDPHFRAR